MNFIDSTAALPAGTQTLTNTDDVLAQPATLREAPAVALHFPKWTDGRAYSQAVLLRARLRYAGDIIATGDVVADMLPLLRRCGFTAVQLRADQTVETALHTLGFFEGVGGGFGGHYQNDVSQFPALLPLPPAGEGRGEGLRLPL